ncbi:hypothetical protein TVAGG3_0405820, partial [Trichomonas vaginalis G3]|uniref:hypothetical protein n=1 Tax=Trichomonas vaginalis (strain ATCC PRA-98 / G3) TaxID=412133 RepID=UPI0021E5C6FD
DKHYFFTTLNFILYEMTLKRLLTDFEYYLIDALTDPQNCVESSLSFKIEGTTHFVFTYVLKEYDRYHNEVNQTLIKFVDKKLVNNDEEYKQVIEKNNARLDAIEKKFNECLTNTYEYLMRWEARWK